MGKDNSSPSLPKAPDQKQTYQEGINVYLQNLPRILQAEMDNRSLYDPQRIAEQQALQNQFGTTQYNQMLSALGQMDPQWTGLHGQLGDQLANNLTNGTPLQGQADKLLGNLSSQYYNGNPDTKKLLNSLSGKYYNGSDPTKQSKALLSDLQLQYAQGTKLSPDELAQQQQEIRRAQASRGNSYGQAPVSAEAYSLGDRGLQLQQQRLGNLQSGLGQYNQFGQQDFSNYMGGLGLRDTEKQNAFGNYMGGFNLSNALNQQNYSNAGSFLSGPSAAQEAGMIPPVSPDRSMAYVNPNAGFQGEQFALQNYQNQLGASQLGQSGGSNPWSTIGSIASVVGPLLGALAFNKGGSVPHRVDYRNMGLKLPQSTDTVPAMLTPGEVVLNKPEQAKVGMNRIKAAVGNRHGKPIMGGVRGFEDGGHPGNINDTFPLPEGGDQLPPDLNGISMVPDIPPADMSPEQTTAPFGSPSQGGPVSTPPPSMNPPGAGPNGLVPPPNVPYVGYMPPPWTKFLPPQAQAVIKMYQLGDKFKNMWQNWRQNRANGAPGQGNNPAAKPDGNSDGYFSPDYLRRIGYEPGQGTGSLWPGGGPSVGPNDIGAYGVGGGGGSFFHDMGGRGGPLAGSFDGLGSFGGGSIETIGGKLGWHQAQPQFGGMTLAQVSKFMPWMLPGLSKMGGAPGGGWQGTKTGPGGVGKLVDQ